MYVCILICMCNRILFPRLAHHEDNGHTRTDPVTAACLVHQVRRIARGTVPARDRPDDQPHRSHTTQRHNKSRRVCTQTHHAETRAHFPTAGATDTVHVHVHVHVRVDAACAVHTTGALSGPTSRCDCDPRVREQVNLKQDGCCRFTPDTSALLGLSMTLAEVARISRQRDPERSSNACPTTVAAPSGRG